MPTRKSLLSILLLCVLVSWSSVSIAQTYLDSTGSPTFTTAFPVESGFINLSNGNLHIEIPLFSRPQRGRLEYSAKLVYDSRIWTPVNYGSGLKWYPVNVAGSQGGWRYVDPGNVGSTSEEYGYSWECWDPWIGYYEEMRVYTYAHHWTDASGTKRTFPIGIAYPVYCMSDPGQPDSEGYATDGSGYFMKITNFTDIRVWAPDGTQVYPQVMDRNGNYFSWNGSGVTLDTLGGTPLAKSEVSSTQTDYTYYPPAGGTAVIKVVTNAVYPSTSFTQSGIGQYPGGAMTVISYVELPNGTRYTFDYSSAGELKSITLPTGGTINYTYEVVTDVAGNQNLWVNERQLGADTSTKWTFTASTCGSYCQRMIVNAPGATQTQYTFDLNPGAPWNTTVDAYAGVVGSSTQIFRKTVGYDTGSPAVAVTSEETTLYSSVAGDVKKKTTFTYDGVDARNFTSVAEWAWIPTGDNYSGSPQRETVTSYVTSSSYLNKHMVDLPLSEIVKQDGVAISKTSYSYDGITLQTASVTNHDGTNFGTGNTIRGNLTSETRCKAMDGNNCATGASVTNGALSSYDVLGNLLSVTDPSGHTTSFEYSSEFAKAWMTKVTRPTTGSGMTHVSQFYYFQNTGLLYVTCGENYSPSWCSSTSYGSADVTKFNYDNMLRPTYVAYADGTASVYSYLLSESSPPVYLGPVEQNYFDGVTSTYKETRLDSYGRISQVASKNGQSPAQWDVVAQCYNARGLLFSRTYPTQTSGGFLSSCDGADRDSFAYDALGRIKQVVHNVTGSSTTSITHDYHAQYHWVTDERSKQKAYKEDGLGRLAGTAEMIGGTGYWTFYQYNALDLITSVIQGDRGPRQLEYDALGRLTRQSSPETGATTGSPWNGATTYTYDNNGNLYQRVRPKPNGASGSVTTTYSFDQINRLLSVSYNDGSTPTSSFFYDDVSCCNYFSPALTNGKGRLIYALNGSGVEYYSYDMRGRTTYTHQAPPRVYGTGSYTLAYTYDGLGNVKTMSNGMNVTFSTNYNVASQPTSVASSWADSTHPSTLLTSTKFNGFGQPLEYTTGDAVKTQFDYTTMGRLRYKDARRNSDNSQVYYLSSNGSPISYLENGLISGVNDNGASKTFSYDDVNRLISGTTYEYDEFGNLKKGAPVSPIQHATSNRINSSAANVVYDAPGNIIQEIVGTSTRNYRYDAENRLVEVLDGNTSIATYVYDVYGRRIKKSANGTSTEYLYDLWGRPITVMATIGGGWLRGEIFAGDMHLATYTNSTTYFPYADWLGTERVRTNPSAIVSQTCSWGDFGSSPSCTGNTDEVAISTHGYAGYEYDKESGLNHMWFRYYNPRLGRFMTVDPYGGSADVANPQSLNRFSYAGNSPTQLSDPLGLDVMCRITLLIEYDAKTGEILNVEILSSFCWNVGGGGGIPGDYGIRDDDYVPQDERKPALRNACVTEANKVSGADQINREANGALAVGGIGTLAMVGAAGYAIGEGLFSGLHGIGNAIHFGPTQVPGPLLYIEGLKKKRQANKMKDRIRAACNAATGVYDD